MSQLKPAVFSDTTRLDGIIERADGVNDVGLGVCDRSLLIFDEWRGDVLIAWLRVLTMLALGFSECTEQTQAQQKNVRNE